MKTKILFKILTLIVMVLLLTYGIKPKDIPVPNDTPGSPSVTIDTQGKPYAVINDNRPRFSEEMLALREAEVYSDLDSLGRCGPAYMVVTKKTLLKGPRGKISQFRPSGWQGNRKDERGELVRLWDRCHLLFASGGGDDRKENLITGTRQLNVEGMLPFEMKVLDYVRKKGNPVLYRVIPLFEGDELVARGVTMEGYSLQDNGKTICFYVFVPNEQKGFRIDYKTGKSRKL